MKKTSKKTAYVQLSLATFISCGSVAASSSASDFTEDYLSQTPSLVSTPTMPVIVPPASSVGESSLESDGMSRDLGTPISAGHITPFQRIVPPHEILLDSNDVPIAMFANGEANIAMPWIVSTHRMTYRRYPNYITLRKHGETRERQSFKTIVSIPVPDRVYSIAVTLHARQSPFDFLKNIYAIDQCLITIHPITLRDYCAHKWNEIAGSPVGTLYAQLASTVPSTTRNVGRPTPTLKERLAQREQEYQEWARKHGV